MRRLILFAALAATSPMALIAQWTIQTPATTADLRGIENVGKGIAWASGSDGTVLRTEDNGYLWQRCTTPPNADHLDFRGIQAFDANTAIVMSSGKGDLSRLYKTTDGCQTWTLLFTNPDKDGFWDAIQFPSSVYTSKPAWGRILGDPVSGSFTIFETANGGKHWIRQRNSGLQADATKNGAFAASNSVLLQILGATAFATGGTEGAFMYVGHATQICVDECSVADQNLDGSKDLWKRVEVPVGERSESSGIFSLASRVPSGAPMPSATLVAVGGDYQKPDDQQNSSAFTTDGGKTWLPATTPPHGYRSAVAYDAPTKTWITVGPNGTDISTDDGRNWRPLKPSPTDTPDADRNWNALSLPFVVGPHGRIGILRQDSLTPTSKAE